MSKQSVSLEKTMGLQEAIIYLEELVTSLKVGRIEVIEGEKRVILCPPSILDVEVEAKVKKDKQKFSLELSWKNQSECTGACDDTGTCNCQPEADSDKKA
jgi:amphi-Trp domain-containing protein